MRTLQEKYNAIQEGSFSKDQFLRDARMQHPTLVTQYNGYDDAVKILKNRGMITEATKETPVEKTVIKEARLTKKSLVDYRYKPTNELDNYPYEQILRGLRVELEIMKILGTPTPEEYQKALGKVLKNLEKDKIFYTNQLAGKKKSDNEHDQMIPVEKNNVVDKANGMEKAPIVKEGADEKYRILPVNKDGKKSFQVMKGDKVEKVFPNRHEAEFHRNKLNKVDLKEGIKNLIKNILKEEDFEYKVPVKKVQKLVDIANTLIEKAVDTDGDPIGVVDTSGTWQEPDYYKPVEFDGKTLVIRSTSQTGGHKEVIDEYEGENLIYDGIPSLQLIIRLYKKALKKHNIEEVMYGDSDGDYDSNKETEKEAYKLYDKGQELYNQGKKEEAEALRQQALKKGSWLGWGEEDLPAYKEESNIFETVSLKDLLG